MKHAVCLWKNCTVPFGGKKFSPVFPYKYIQGAHSLKGYKLFPFYYIVFVVVLFFGHGNILLFHPWGKFSPVFPHKWKAIDVLKC